MSDELQSLLASAPGLSHKPSRSHNDHRSGAGTMGDGADNLLAHGMYLDAPDDKGVYVLDVDAEDHTAFECFVQTRKFAKERVIHLVTPGSEATPDRNNDLGWFHEAQGNGRGGSCTASDARFGLTYVETTHVDTAEVTETPVYVLLAHRLDDAEHLSIRAIVRPLDGGSISSSLTTEFERENLNEWTETGLKNYTARRKFFVEVATDLGIKAPAYESNRDWCDWLKAVVRSMQDRAAAAMKGCDGPTAAPTVLRMYGGLPRRFYSGFTGDILDDNRRLFKYRYAKPLPQNATILVNDQSIDFVTSSAMRATFDVVAKGEDDAEMLKVTIDGIDFKGRPYFCHVPSSSEHKRALLAIQGGGASEISGIVMTIKGIRSCTPLEVVSPGFAAKGEHQLYGGKRGRSGKIKAQNSIVMCDWETSALCADYSNATRESFEAGIFRQLAIACDVWALKKWNERTPQWYAETGPNGFEQYRAVLQCGSIPVVVAPVVPANANASRSVFSQGVAQKFIDTDTEELDQSGMGLAPRPLERAHIIAFQFVKFKCMEAIWNAHANGLPYTPNDPNNCWGAVNPTFHHYLDSSLPKSGGRKKTPPSAPGWWDVDGKWVCIRTTPPVWADQATNDTHLLRGVPNLPEAWLTPRTKVWIKIYIHYFGESPKPWRAPRKRKRT